MVPGKVGCAKFPDMRSRILHLEIFSLLEFFIMENYSLRFFRLWSTLKNFSYVLFYIPLREQVSRRENYFVC